MPSRRANLEAKAEKASRVKRPLGMDAEEAFQLREQLLRISRMTLKTYDCLSLDQMSQHDVYEMLQIPELLNEVLGAMQRFAKAKVDAGH